MLRRCYASLYVRLISFLLLWAQQSGVHTVLALLLVLLLYFVGTDHNIEKWQTAALSAFSSSGGTYQPLTSTNESVALSLSGNGQPDTLLVNEPYQIKVQVNLTSMLNDDSDWYDVKSQKLPNLVLWIQSATERLVLEEPVNLSRDTWLVGLIATETCVRSLHNNQADMLASSIFD